MKVIRLADCPVVPWKNGGGTTTEIAVSPEGAGHDAFDWRVSMAEVASDGPFSLFPGIDRTITVIEGEGMELTIEGSEAVVLGVDDAPLDFPGDVQTSAKLLKGPIRDLNVMTRRGRFRHRVSRLKKGAMPLDTGGDVAMIFAIGGIVWLSIDGKDVELRSGDVLLIATIVETRMALASIDSADCYSISIARTS